MILSGPPRTLHFHFRKEAPSLKQENSYGNISVTLLEGYLTTCSHIKFSFSIDLTIFCEYIFNEDWYT